MHGPQSSRDLAVRLSVSGSSTGPRVISIVKIAFITIVSKFGTVGRCTERDGFGGPRYEVAELMGLKGMQVSTSSYHDTFAHQTLMKSTYDFLNAVNTNVSTIFDNGIMSWLSSAQITNLRSKEEVPSPLHCDTTVNNSAWLGITPIDTSLLGRMEAGVMAVATDDIGDPWLPSLIVVVYGLTSTLDEAKLLLWDCLERSRRQAAAIDEDVGG